MTVVVTQELLDAQKVSGDLSHSIRRDELERLGWTRLVGSKRILDSVLHSMRARLKAESMARSYAVGMQPDGSMPMIQTSDGRMTADIAACERLPTGQEQGDELQRRFYAWEKHVVGNNIEASDIGTFSERILSDSESLLKEIGAWDDMPACWRECYPKGKSDGEKETKAPPVKRLPEVDKKLPKSLKKMK